LTSQGLVGRAIRLARVGAAMQGQVHGPLLHRLIGRRRTGPALHSASRRCAAGADDGVVVVGDDGRFVIALRPGAALHNCHTFIPGSNGRQRLDEAADGHVGYWAGEGGVGGREGGERGRRKHATQRPTTPQHNYNPGPDGLYISQRYPPLPLALRPLLHSLIQMREVDLRGRVRQCTTVSVCVFCRLCLLRGGTTTLPGGERSTGLLSALCRGVWRLLLEARLRLGRQPSLCGRHVQLPGCWCRHHSTPPTAARAAPNATSGRGRGLSPGGDGHATVKALGVIIR